MASKNQTLSYPRHELKDPNVLYRPYDRIIIFSYQLTQQKLRKGSENSSVAARFYSKLSFLHNTSAIA